ncbi:hypothetical protein BHE74_00031979, partial [Ensete ventricosum]
QNPSRSICSNLFTVGHSKNCDLQLSDPSVGTTLCVLRQTKCGGAPVTLLETVGAKGVIQVNGKIVDKNSIILIGGDEVAFSRPEKHIYIFQQLPKEKLNTPTLHKFHSSLETKIASKKGLKFEKRPGDHSAAAVVSMLASLSTLKKDLSVHPSSVPSEPMTDLELSANTCKLFEDQRESAKDFELLASLSSTRSQVFKDGLKRGIIDASDIEVSFDNFPYYLSENTKQPLVSCAFVHLKCKEFLKYTSEISSLSQRVLLSGPPGSEIYQETLVKALAKEFDARVLIIDCLTLLGHRRPTSTVKADIVESSVLDTEPLPKQETSTASLKSCPFKKGIFLTLLLNMLQFFVIDHFSQFSQLCPIMNKCLSR